MLGSAPFCPSFGLSSRRAASLAVCAALAIGGLGQQALAWAFPSPAVAVQQDLSDLFKRGMVALDQGDDAAALEAFERILAMDPSREDAYQLWRSTDARALQTLLIKQGQFEVIALRLMGLARGEVLAKRDDPEAIRALLSGLEELDPLQRRQRVSELRAQHGEFAVPMMLPSLADESGQERRVKMMLSLTELGSAAVPPLIEALGASSEFLRRNVAVTLGRIGDGRAAGALALVARDDPSAEVRGAAQASLSAMGQIAVAPEQLLIAQGNAYLAGDLSVMDPYLVSPVVWNFSGGRLEARPVPAALYGTQMARGAFLRAMTANPGSEQALGGLARAGAKAGVLVEDLVANGGDEDSLRAFAAEGALLSGAAGPQAFAPGLAAALEARDYASAVGLLRHFAHTGVSVNQALLAALADGHPQVRAEAALAAAQVASRGGSEVPARAIVALGEAAGREVVRAAVVIDPDTNRAEAVARNLRSRNLAVAVANRAAQGLLTLRQLPGVDLIVIADRFPDLTVDQLIQEIDADSRTASAPKLMMAADAAAAEELYGSKVTAVASAFEELPPLEEILSEGLNRDRAEADALSQRAAAVLADLAQRGQAINDAVEGLTRTLAGRPDSVVLPALKALTTGGTPAQAAAVLGVLADAARSDEARVAAADSLAGIFARARTQATDELTTPLVDLLADAQLSPALRQATSEALGALGLNPELRLDSLRRLAQPVAQ